MEHKYNLNDVALMTGLTTRTLRNYLTQGFLNGKKIDGTWLFTEEDLDHFFNDPFVKEGIRIKRTSVVFDFLAQKNMNGPRSCIILDIPGTRKKCDKISAFFCKQMNEAVDVRFNYGYDKGFCRIILSGNATSVTNIINAYNAMDFND